MDMEDFRKHLRTYGKKPHVVKGLIRQVSAFADFLEHEREKGLDSATADDLQDYVGKLEPAETRTRIRIRGLIFYYHFSGNSSLAALAHRLREEETARNRRLPALRDLRGVDLDTVRVLAERGIVNVDQMLEAGRTPEARGRLAAETGLPAGIILELVRLSDLSRVRGVKQVRARLYLEAGIDTLEKAAACDPEALRRELVEFVERTGFEGLAPLPKEVQHFVRTAGELPKIVQY